METRIVLTQEEDPPKDPRNPLPGPQGAQRHSPLIQLTQRKKVRARRIGIATIWWKRGLLKRKKKFPPAPLTRSSIIGKWMAHVSGSSNGRGNLTEIRRFVCLRSYFFPLHSTDFVFSYNYILPQWVPEEEVLEIGGGKMRIRNFRTNPPPQPREPYYPAEYEMADRIIAERVVDLSSDEEEEDVEMDDSKKKEQKEYLVKWKALGYAESTWEKEDDLPQEHIDLYVERNTPPTCKPMERLIYRKGIQPPEFRDPALRLRPYQVIGFRWLLFSYAKDVNVILGDEMGMCLPFSLFLFFFFSFFFLNSFLLFFNVSLRSWENNSERLFSLLFVPMPKQQWSFLGGLPSRHFGAMETRNRVLDDHELSFIPWERCGPQDYCRQ